MKVDMREVAQMDAEADRIISMREVDEHGRALYKPFEIPPQDARFAIWRGRLTHPEAVASSHHAVSCVGGWIASGDWWLHCGECQQGAAA